MPLRDDLLNPIPGDNPSGADLRYDPLYDKIKEARREEDDVPQGAWERARKTADHAQVIKLASDALATKSKDLQLAAWLTEALLKREGLSGLHAGLGLIRGLLEQYWDTLYPEIEDGDLELRAGPVSWVGTKLDVAVRLAPIDRAGHHLLQYTRAQTLGTEAEAAQEESKRTAREAAVAAKEPVIEDFDKQVVETPKAFFKQLAAAVDGSLETLQALNELGEQKFGDESPNVIPLRGALEEVQRVAHRFLQRKLELDPDPVEVVAAVAAAAEGASGDGGAGGGATGMLAAEPTSREDAAARVISAARYLRRTEPGNPASYLMLRALRWGELRAAGSAPDPKLLDAPGTATRTQLRGLMLDENWEQLLEAAETAMGTPVGRGWLDLQRYALTACQNLGGDYAVVGSAIRSELRTLLAALPSLPNMTLMDDLPTATGPTLNWLREQGLVGGEPEAAPVELEPAAEGGSATPAAAARDTSQALARASAEVRAGRPEKAIELLMRALDREKTRRGRFLRQAELAGIMVDAGFAQVAQPILEELMGDIEAHRLETWEAGEMVARPLALMYACLQKADGTDAARKELYLRIARLDPLQAIGVGQG